MRCIIQIMQIMQIRKSTCPGRLKNLDPEVEIATSQERGCVPTKCRPQRSPTPHRTYPGGNKSCNTTKMARSPPPLPAAQCGSKKIIVETLENTANLTRCRQPLIPERYVVVCYVVQCLHKEICFYAHVVQTVNTGGLVAWSDGELAAERSRSHFNASLHSTLTLFASVGRKGLFRR